MSTRIYDAYITDARPSHILHSLQKLKEQLLASSKIELRRLLTPNPVEGVTSEMLCESRLLIARVGIMSVFRGQHTFNKTCSAVIYILAEKTVVQFFGIDKSMKLEIAGFLEMVNGKDYHYQNQTDKPDDVSDEEWAERERFWDAVFDIDPIPANVGFTYELITEKEAIALLIGAVAEFHPPECGWEKTLAGSPFEYGIFKEMDIRHAYRTKGVFGLLRQLTKLFFEFTRTKPDSLTSSEL
jgi:hypothetical protein